jgi:hypothetical protein
LAVARHLPPGRHRAGDHHLNFYDSRDNLGACAEPANVKAGGTACPYRFRCAGCDHFRTDISYLPDLQTYLDDLLRSGERILAAATTDIDVRQTPENHRHGETGMIRPLNWKPPTTLASARRHGQSHVTEPPSNPGRFIGVILR